MQLRDCVDQGCQKNELHTWSGWNATLAQISFRWHKNNDSCQNHITLVYFKSLFELNNGIETRSFVNHHPWIIKKFAKLRILCARNYFADCRFKRARNCQAKWNYIQSKQSERVVCKARKCFDTSWLVDTSIIREVRDFLQTAQ